jgi:hypothetical protein
MLEQLPAEESNEQLAKEENGNNQHQTRQRKNRELSYMQTSNIIDTAGTAARGPNANNAHPLAQRLKQSKAVKEFFQRAKLDRSVDFYNIRRQSLDQRRIPQELEHYFPHKVRIYD